MRHGLLETLFLLLTLVLARAVDTRTQLLEDEEISLATPTTTNNCVTFAEPAIVITTLSSQEERTTTTTTTSRTKIMSPISRTVSRVLKSRPMMEGAGVRIRRTIGMQSIRDEETDPFLLLDEFKSDDPNDYVSGFPDHPHRGFETVTYMLDGHFEHRDSRGNCGQLTAGSVQWMTAGRGVIHSEMPKQVKGLVWGFQLWVNLSSKNKMTEPRYQDIQAERIPSVTLDEKSSVRVIAGSFKDTVGPVDGVEAKPLYFDARVGTPAKEIFFDVPVDHSAFVYVYEGSASVGDASNAQLVGESTLAMLENTGTSDGGTGVRVVTGDTGARFLVVAAQPFREPIVRRGPFVLNTEEQLYQAFRDYRDGTLA